jgi:hypothetical protein
LGANAIIQRIHAEPKATEPIQENSSGCKKADQFMPRDDPGTRSTIMQGCVSCQAFVNGCHPPDLVEPSVVIASVVEAGPGPRAFVIDYCCAGRFRTVEEIAAMAA